MRALVLGAVLCTACGSVQPTSSSATGATSGAGAAAFPASREWKAAQR